MKLPPMIDNITLMLEIKPPPQLHKAKGQPFEYKGRAYCPKYRNGQLCGYETQIKNLRVYVYPERIYLTNSLHKFFKSNNYSDFTKSELRAAIENISDTTGIRWNKATVKKIEYGCNVSAKATNAIHSLQSYKGKDFQPMAKNGIRYGAACDFAQYRIKGYNKTFELKHTDKINLQTPIFRWEIQVKNPQYFNRMKQPIISAGQLLTGKVLFTLANDAVTKYENSIKMQHLNLYKLSAEQKKIIAVMHNPEIRQDFKIHHKEAYKKYNRIYRQIMQDKSICSDDNTGQILAAKFAELLAN
jgi:hypothetical protein